jgi:hypothetical protein
LSQGILDVPIPGGALCIDGKENTYWCGGPHGKCCAERFFHCVFVALFYRYFAGLPSGEIVVYNLARMSVIINKVCVQAHMLAFCSTGLALTIAASEPCHAGAPVLCSQSQLITGCFANHKHQVHS